MNIDGKQIQRELKNSLREQVKSNVKKPSLGLVVARETPEIRSFVNLKQKFGRDIGVHVGIETLDPLHKKTEDFLQLVLHATREYDGLVIQLPLPTSLDLESVLKLFPMSHDVDVLGHTAFQQFKEGTLPFHPPVVAAMAEILDRNEIRPAGMRTLIVGEGRLVGAPAAIWVSRLGAIVKSVNKTTDQLDEWLKGADLIISGAGSPGIIRPDNIKEGVVILDAGTGESEGVLKGDADPACAQKARLFTPTPGGIGPIVVAKVFENLLALAALKNKRAT
jgi:methylenetetrahydrofolate dehydrogenase (NADP+)/methenyltetrahydrofolate cyclohydrolase